MATYDFTVRAEDETGAFSDRAFSIQVRNNLVDRLLAINGTNAYSSIDGVNWTTRAGKGGIWCDNILGKWIVIQNSTTYRISEDAINWKENLNFVLSNDPEVVDDEGEIITPAGTLHGLSFTISQNTLSIINGIVLVIADINGKLGLIKSTNLEEWYLIDGSTDEFNSNYFGVADIGNSLDRISSIVLHNNKYVIYSDIYKGFIVSDNLLTFTTIKPNNSNILNWSYKYASGRHTRIDIISTNDVLTLSLSNGSDYSYSTNNKNRVYNLTNRLFYTVNLTDINIPTNGVIDVNSSPVVPRPITSIMRNRNLNYINGFTFMYTSGRIIKFTSPVVVSNQSAGAINHCIYKGVVWCINNGGRLSNWDIDTNTQTLPTTNGLPTSGLVSIAAL